MPHGALREVAFRAGVLPALVIVATSLLPSITRANSAAPFSRPTGAMPGVVVERPSPLVVEREDLAIQCAQEGNDSPIQPTCTFLAKYALANPTANEEEVLGAFYTADRPAAHGARTDPDPIAIALGGKNVAADATPEQLARMDAIVRGDHATAELLVKRSLELHRTPFRISVAAGAKATLTFAGTLQAIAFADERPLGGYETPVIVARHPFLGPDARSSFTTSSDEFLYLVSPLAHWAGDPDVHVTVEHLSSDVFSSEQRFRPNRHGRTTSESIVLRASTGENLRFRLDVAPSAFQNGGPVLGIGPRIGRKELHTRFAYEVGIGAYGVLGAAVDTNFEDYLTTAATFDVGTPNVIGIIPSLMVGAGLPIEFRKNANARVGVRAQLGLSFPVLSISFPVDIYPAANSSGSHVEGSFLTAVSF